MNSRPATFWILRDARDEFYAYSVPETGVRCTDRIQYAMYYKTRKGALIAAANIRRAYGKQLWTWQYKTVTTYLPV